MTNSIFYLNSEEFSNPKNRNFKFWPLCNIDDKANPVVASLFRICYKCITENVQANINNNINSIDWFNFLINDLFFQHSVRCKVDQIKKATNFIEITFTSIENIHKCFYYFKY